MSRACVLSQGRQRAEALARQRRRSLLFIGRRAESGAGVAARDRHPFNATAKRSRSRR